MAENLRPVGSPQPDRHVDGETVEEGTQPGREAVGVDGPELPLDTPSAISATSGTFTAYAAGAALDHAGPLVTASPGW